MINMVRIDERLIHGQVAMIWSKQLGVDRIIVVNEKAATDPILSSTLKMAAPDSVKVIILNEEKAKVLLKDPRINDLNILVIVKMPRISKRSISEIMGRPAKTVKKELS